jgi:hypothetical protein
VLLLLLQVVNAATKRSFLLGRVAVGHTRLGNLPKTQKWLDLVERISGSRVSVGALSAASYVEAIAAQTLEASKAALDNAKHDSGVLYAFYLLTQVTLASRSANWEDALALHGIRLASDTTVFDLTSEIQSAIDRHVSRSSSGATDLSEMAQQSVGEALMSLADTRTLDLFGGSSDDVRNAIRTLSTKKGFGELGQRFFGRFVARFLNFYLSRATAAALGGARLQDLADIAEFNENLRTHCDQSARIVRDFCGEWYSKTAYQEGIDLENASRFLAVAVRKLSSELEHQGSEARQHRASFSAAGPRLRRVIQSPQEEARSIWMPLAAGRMYTYDLKMSPRSFARTCPRA